MDETSAEKTGCQWGGKDKARRFYAQIDAVDPRDGKLWTVLLAEAKFRQQAGRPWAASTLAYNVPEVLRTPSAIFVGIREGEELDERCWLAYTGSPGHRYASNGDAIPCPQNRVFIVYLTADRTVYSWRWEKVDPDGTGLPIGYADGRFRTKVL